MTSPPKLSEAKRDSTYVLLAGLPGSGKSTLANALSQRLTPSVVLNKDSVRVALFPGTATDYSDAQNNLCVEAMLLAADYLARKGPAPRFIFFDGRTFSSPPQIAQVTQAAEKAGSPWRILLLRCPDTLALARIAESSVTHPAKDRDAVLYASLKAVFQPIQQPHLSIDTSCSLDQCVAAAAAYLTEDSSAF